ncbi:YadA-like family protein [Haemophilus haemolyticus]|uniref:YadA-like family protein n=1 Tax=Haemophilus haemolyticus TaxID=726 RepID=UPI000E584F39|nr:YadA-like family protein [Haemophilus haemolyticus]
MNKIFRVVWSQATQSWVVVSELTKAHKKQSSSNAQKSAVNFSGNFIKSSAIALALLSGHSAYAAEAASGLIQINSKGMATATSSDSIAIGKDSKAIGNNNSLAIGHSAQATGNDGALAIGRESKAAGNNGIALGRKAETTANDSMALGFQAKASGDSGIALGNQANAENKYTVAIGRESKASGDRNIALGYQATANNKFAIAIGAGASAQKFNNAVAIGANAQANGATSLALGMESKTTGHDSYAIGYRSETIGDTSIAFGRQSTARGKYDIVMGAEAETRDQDDRKGYSIAIGAGAMSGTNKPGKNLNGGDAGGVAIGTGAYTGVNRNNISLNSAVAVGAGAGAGFRKLDNNGMPAQNATDVDNNDEVLKKAFGVKNVADYQKIAGGTNGYTNVDINEATALGRNARAIGDQSVAIGAQTIAGMGAIALGGNDITQFANKKYYKSTKENFAVTETIDHNQDAKISDDTISGAYNRLVGTALDTQYKATYAQDGSVVLGAQAHSGTPLGTALGTNALIRKGAFGATAIGAGSQVQANAEAAVAIGMGSFANGKYAVAAGTGSRAELGDIAMGYKAQASGKQGAIAIGQSTNAQGDSSIMIGGANISNAAAQITSYKAERKNPDGSHMTYTKEVTERINGQDVKRTYTFVSTENKTGKVEDAYAELTGKPMNVKSLDYNDSKNSNGHASTSIGVHSLAQGNLASAYGASSRAIAIGSLALGTGAIADRQNAVAIGTGSTTDLVGTRQLDASYDKYGNWVASDSPDAVYKFRWAGGINTSEGDVVSFGSSGAERQLKNVAAGRVAEDSTDAINGSQLNSVARKVASGWQIAGNEKTKVAGIGSDDQVNFTDGKGTTVTVMAQDAVKETVTENGKQVEKIKTPKGANVKFDIKNADDSLEVGTNGVKVKTSDGIETTTNGIKVNTGKGLKIDAADGNKVAVNTDDKTITVSDDGTVKAVAGTIETVTAKNKVTGEKVGQVRPAKDDKGKLATVDAVANAVNNAAWSITSDTDGGSFATSGHTKTTEKISAGGSVTFKAGNNLIIKQAGTDFTYSLNPILNGLTSAEFKGTGENAPITKLTNAGITVTTPADAVANTPEKTVTLNQDGLNNGGNAISNVKSNLPATKNSDTANTAAAPSNATKTQAVPNTTNMKGTDYVNPNNAATVGDVLNAGWNLKGKGTAVDFVKAYDTVDFVDGDGTTASVESKDGQTSTVKYSVNTTTIKPDTANAGKVKAEGTGNTFATAETVASAINDAYWKAAASGNGATTDVADNVKAGDTVTFKAGKNLTVTHNNTNKSFEFATTDTPEFSSVQFGNNGPKITHDGDNLKVTKADGTSPTKITNVADGSDNNDAVNVSQLKASGWKVAGNNKTEVNTINPSEQVNFLDGSGTTVSVTKDTDTAGKETGNVNVKYDVNVGNGLQKDTTGNTISVKPADSTITVGANGVKVNTGDIATESTGKAATALDKAIADATKELADATKAGDTAAQQKAQEKLAAANAAKTAAGKQIATVENVTEAINKAGWNAIAAKTANGEVSGEAVQLVKPGETVIFEADKNVKIAQNGSKFTFSTKDNVEFKSVKVGEEKDGKKPVSLTTSVATPADNNQTGKAPTTALNISSGTGKDAKPTQITGVGSVLNMVTNADQQPKLVNLGTAHGQTALDNNILNSAATVRDLANMGWKVSSDKVTGAENKSYSDVVRNADEVKFVGTNAAKVSGKTENGVRTITVDVEVPDVKTAKLVSSTDGSVIAPSTGSKLQDALKTAKDELAALPDTATEAEKEAAENKVKVAETALNKALDDKGVATAKNVADMINNSGFTLKTSAAADGKKDDKSTGSEVIKSGKTVEMVAGKNLTVKQEANGKVTYSLNPELSNLTSAEFKADGKPTTKISSDGITITPAAPTTGGEQKPNVSLTENGLNNGGNAITNVAGNLDGARTGTDAPTTSATKPTALTETNAATVGDVLNSGWNIQEKGTAKDFVKAYDTVNFDEGDGTDVSVGVSADGKTSTVKYSVKAADKSLEVGANGVKVKVSDGIETTTNGIAVKAADKTLTVGKDGVKVNTGAIAAANGGKVTVTPKTKADGTTETQAEAETRAASEIATVKNVADAINSAAWIAKVENTDDSVDTPTKNDKGTAVKAGDTLNLKAGKNLKAKRDGQNITFALAKDITVETANVENTLSIGKDRAKVNIASGANGLTLSGTETAADGSTNNNAPIYLNGIKPTLTDTLAGSPTTNITGNIDAAAYHRAASVQDVLNAGWNIRGAKKAGGEVENVDFVRTYDTVDFVSGNKATTDVTVVAKEGGKGAVVTITAKNDAGSITTAGGKVVVGTKGQADTDPKAGDKVAKTGDVANAINQSGWKTNATKIDGKAATDANKTQLINPGDAVNYENGNGTVANVEVTQGKDGNPDTVSVKYDVKADGTTIKVGDDGKVTAVTGETKAVTADADGKKKGQLKAKDGDGSKLATVESVANAVNSAKWYAKADNDQTATVSDTGKTTNDDGAEMGAGDALTLTAGKNLRVKRDGKNFTFATVEKPEFEGVTLKKGGNTVNIAPTANGLDLSKQPAAAGGAAQPVSITGVTSGLATYPQVGNKDTPQTGLVDLSKPSTGTPTVGDNTAATVGDLRGMGWVLSADKETDNPAKTYNAQVKNAEEVKFVGASGVIVSGKTEGNVRTITVGVDHQLATNNSVKPVEYTKKDGTKVYPKTVTNGGKTETKFYPNADGTGDEVSAGDVIVSVNGANGTTSPTTLSNVKSNLPETRNTADAADPTGKPASKSQSAPTIGTADGNVNANNAATVGDILNSGWNLKGNGSAVDFVRAYDTVNFVNGKGTTVSIETDGKESRVKVDVDTADLTASNGKISAPDLKTLEDAVEKAKADAKANPADEAKKTALAKAEADLAKEQNKGVTAQNVAKAINESGFTLKTSATVEGKKDAASTGDEVINPGKTVEMVAGKNLTVKQDAGGKVTYATKDDVEFATVKIGKDEDGKKPVSLTTEKAVNASNNETGKEPETALKISSDGKPAQLVGVASVLNTSEVSTKPNGDKKADGKPAESKTEKLIDLAGTKAAPVNKNAAATVGDLQNMGWVVSTKDGNGYTDVVKNAGKVDFKGGKGIEVTGKTLTDGTREITVGIKEGTVTNNVKVTKEDGTVIEAIRDKDGKLYEKDVNGKVDKTKPVETTNKDKVENNGSGFVTGNTVATAIQESGWNVGLADSSKANKAFNDNSKALSADTLEKVNPDDNVRFADGKNTKVQAATMDEVNKDGKKITNTYVRFNVDLPISQIISEDKNGNKVAKADDGNWYPVKDNQPDKTKQALDPSEVRTSASMDPDGLGDKYTSTTSREEGLTSTQLGELTGKQEAAAEAAKTKIKELLRGQPDNVINAASEAAEKAAKEEAKVQYLKDKGLDKGTGGTVISNVAWGTKPSDAVNVDQLQNSGINVHSRKVEGSTGKVISAHTLPTKVKMDETVNVDAGNNIEITRNGRDIAIATSMTPQFDSVQFGKEGPKITGKAAQPAKPATATSPAMPAQPAELSVNGAKITDVAPGRISATSTDAVNGSQLHAVASSLGNLNNKINKVGKRADAGTASALAAATIPQAYTPGKSLVGIAAGNYQGQNGLAIGMSRISDNGKIIIRLSGTANTQGKTGIAAGVGYQW